MSDVDFTQTHDRALPERAKELAADARREVLGRANDQGRRGMTALGEQLSRAADALRSNLGDGEVPVLDREHVDRVAGALHSAASYLVTKDPEAVLADVDGVVRRHPYGAVAVGLGLGYVVGRWMRSDR